jgi:hypothetical protein
MSRTETKTVCLAQLDAQNHRNWQERIADDRELGQIEHGIARCARLMATEPRSSPIYAHAKHEDIQLRIRRRIVWDKRAQAKAEKRP